jgi:transposase-like protein
MAKLGPSKAVTRVRFPPPASSGLVDRLLSEMKTAERQLARALRREHGVSVKRLARMLGVSQSSISLWVRDIELTDDQRAKLRPCGVKGGAVRAALGLERRRKAQELGRKTARTHDPLHIAGCMLYWAEGSRNRHAVEFVNSDPAMVAFFLGFLRSCFDVPDRKVRIACNLFADHLLRQEEIERFWLRTLGLPRSCMRKSAVNRYSKYSQKKRRNKLPYGTCRLVVCDTTLVQHIYGAIQEYGRFDREDWVL